MNGGPRPVALITGASAGFGAAIARRLAKAHYNVVLIARRADRLAELAEEIGKDKALAVPLDLRDRASVAGVVKSLPEPFAAVSCLVNNAGLALGLFPAQSSHGDDWETMIATNCTGLTRMTRAVLPVMMARGCGHVINLGSVAGSYPYPGGNVYGATKAFVRQFSLNLRSDLHGTGIRVTCIEPGMCGGTEFSTVRFGGDAEGAAATYAGMTPLSPDDIAEAVCWVLGQPPHVNVNNIELMPVAQSFAPFQVARNCR